MSIHSLAKPHPHSVWSAIPFHPRKRYEWKKVEKLITNFHQYPMDMKGQHFVKASQQSTSAGIHYVVPSSGNKSWSRQFGNICYKTVVILPFKYLDLWPALWCQEQTTTQSEQLMNCHFCSTQYSVLQSSDVLPGGKLLYTPAPTTCIIMWRTESDFKRALKALT